MNPPTAKKFIYPDGFIVELTSKPKKSNDSPFKKAAEYSSLITGTQNVPKTTAVDLSVQQVHDLLKTPPQQRTQKSSSDVNDHQNPPLLTMEDLLIFETFYGESSPPETIRDTIVCPICYRQVDFEREGYQLFCDHKFCKLCLIDEIRNNFDARGQVSCPMGSEICTMTLEEIEIRIILGDDYYAFNENVTKMIAETAEKLQQDELLAEELQNQNKTFIANKDEFECQICFTEAPPGDGIVIKTCRHRFCRECLIGHIMHSDEVIVTCPSVDNCGDIITEREMRGFVPSDVLEKHHQKSLKEFEGKCSQTFHCKKPDCEGFVEIDENVKGFRCQICDETNCVDCKAIHTNKTCEEYKDSIDPEGRKKREEEKSELAIKTMIKKQEAMYCPRCRIPVMKTVGCDYITCTTCKLGICWVTKKPRMPLTRSDGVFINGCHCRETGPEIRCHPNCKFCH